MKLKFFFILMDLATLLAYPVVFVLGVQIQFSKFLIGKTLTNSAVINAKP
jgi:hypothetical protein